MFHAVSATRATHDAPRGDLTLLAHRAALGDPRAWPVLVHRLGGLLHGVARRYRLAPADVDDVVQTTWLRALTHLSRLQDPGAIVAWLTVTVRREAMRVARRRTREVLARDVDAPDAPDPDSPEALAIARERRAALRGAIGRLPARQQRLMSSLLSQPAPTYTELSCRLGMPIGSIGPTRERAFARLRRDVDLTWVL